MDLCRLLTNVSCKVSTVSSLKEGLPLLEPSATQRISKFFIPVPNALHIRQISIILKPKLTAL